MRYFPAVFVITVAAFSWKAATAFPDGAPWGAANPAEDPNCATCHFTATPVLDSASLVIDGLPANPQPGATYGLTVSFAGPNMLTAGFQLVAQAEDRQAGLLRSSADNVEFIGSAIRSITTVSSENGASWSVEWHTPQDIKLPIVFYLAASAANDDGSPFGDTVHFRQYRLPRD